MVRELLTTGSRRDTKLPCSQLVPLGPVRTPQITQKSGECLAGIWGLVRVGGKTPLPGIILLALKTPAAASAGCEDSAPLGPSACHG